MAGLDTVSPENAETDSVIKYISFNLLYRFFFITDFHFLHARVFCLGVIFFTDIYQLNAQI